MRSGFKLGTFLSLCVAAAMASCGSDESTPAPGVCGNNVAEANEACDGQDLKGQTCATFMMGAMTGSLSCDSSCNLVLAGCNGGGGAGGMGPTP